MIKRLVVLMISFLFFLSCRGILWEGEQSNQLTLTINNPFYQLLSPSASRALALNGHYLYIELALIENQQLFNSDTDKAISGNGIWEYTEWGGHAIVSLSLSDLTEIIEATFVNIPRGVDLQVRAILDTSEADFLSGLAGTYNESNNPLCQTYNPYGATYAEKQWLSVDLTELDDNLMDLSIRPYEPELLDWASNLYMEDYSLEPSVNYPSVGETRFLSLNPDISSIQALDVAFFSISYGNVLLSGAPPDTVAYLYDVDGTPFERGTPSYTFNDPYYEYRDLQIISLSLSEYSSPGYFLGATKINDTGLDWYMSYGLIYDNAPFLDAETLTWYLPPGLNASDFTFRVIHFTDPNLTLPDLDTVDEILNGGYQTDLDKTDISGTSLTDPILDLWDGSWLVVLVYIPDGSISIFSVIKAPLG